MSNIDVFNEGGYKWYSRNGISVRGFIYDDYDQLYENYDLLDYFEEVTDEQSFCRKLIKANGIFSVVIEKSNLVFASVDRLRVMPLFYSFNDELYIKDLTCRIKYYEKDLNEESVIEYLNSGYVTGDKTLLNNWKQIQAGEYIIYNIESKNIRTKRYFNYIHNDYIEEEKEILISKLGETLEKVFERIIKKLNGRCAVVPLSGGYDSRLIVYMFRKFNYENVLCFTYGKKRNWESKISKKVAAHYRYKWFFIEYTKQNLNDLYNNEIDDFIRFSFNMSSVAHTQDLLAVKLLKEDDLIPPDSVFIPGHSGDFVAGSHLSYNMCETNFNLTECIVNMHFNIFKGQLSDDQKKIIKKNVDNFREELGYKNLSNDNIFESWEWQERQSKYTCNSIKVYEYFGYEYLLPLWDKEYMDYWLQINFNHRLDRKLYFSYVQTTDQICIPINPNRNIILKYYDKIFDVWWGRFFRKNKIWNIATKRYKDLFDDSLLKYVDKNIKIRHCSKVSINISKILEVYFKGVE